MSTNEIVFKELRKAGYGRIEGSNYLYTGDFDAGIDSLVYVHGSDILEIDLEEMQVVKPKWHPQLDILTFEQVGRKLLAPSGLILDDQPFTILWQIGDDTSYFGVHKVKGGYNAIVIKRAGFCDYKWAFLFPKWDAELRLNYADNGSTVERIRLQDSNVTSALSMRTLSFDLATKKITTLFDAKPKSGGGFEFTAKITEHGTAFARSGEAFQVLTPESITNMRYWAGDKLIVYAKGNVGVVYLPPSKPYELLLDFNYLLPGFNNELDDDGNLLLQDATTEKYGIFKNDGTWAIQPAFDKGWVVVGVFHLADYADKGNASRLDNIKYASHYVFWQGRLVPFKSK